LFEVFQVFHIHVARVSCGCCICCHDCTHMLQVYYSKCFSFFGRICAHSTLPAT
jgi:hypothetical protein